MGRPAAVCGGPRIDSRTVAADIQARPLEVPPMKFVWVVIVLASTLAGVGLACGPGQTYCYDEHKSCEQARQEKDQVERDRIAAENARRADAGLPPIDG